MKNITPLILSVIGLIAGPFAVAQTTIESGFETGTTVSPYALQSSNGNNVYISNWGEGSARKGSKVAKFSWYEDNYLNNRSTRGIEASSEDVIRINEEGWYGFSFFVNDSGDNAFRFDTGIGIAQALENGGSSCDYISWTWILDTGPDGVVLSHRFMLTGQSNITLSPTVPTGRWVDVIFHMKYGQTFEQPDTGLIEVWFDEDCDGEKGPPSYSFYDTRLGTGCWTDDSLTTGTHLKYGMYCHDVDDYIDGEKRVIYFDQVTGIEGNPDNAWYLVNPDDPTGATPPAVPSGLYASETLNGTLGIEWLKNIEPDFAGYNVYRSISGRGEFIRINESLVTLPEFVDATATVGTQYYKITSVDISGNESALSDATTGVLSTSNPFTIFEAEAYDGQSGIRTEDTDDTGNGSNVSYISNNDWTRYDNMSLTTDTEALFRVARPTGVSDGRIEVRLGSTTGELIGSVDVPETGGWQEWETVSVSLDSEEGEYTLYLRYVEVDASTGGSIFNFNWFALALPNAVATTLSAMTSGPSEIDLSWEAIGSATGYHLKRSIFSGGPYVTVASDLTTNAYTDASLSAETTYYYVVSVLYSDDESDESPEVNATTSEYVGPPITIEAEDYDEEIGVDTEDTTDAGGGLNVGFISSGDWTRYDGISLVPNAVAKFRVARPSGRADGRIEVRLGSSSGELIGWVDVPATGGWQKWQTVETTLAAVSGEHSIYLVFVEVDTSGGGYLFNFNWFSLELPDGPSNIRASAGAEQVDLSWDEVVGASSYYLKRSISSGGPYSVVGDQLATTAYSDLNVSAGGEYYYVASASYAVVEGENSAEVSAIPWVLLNDENLSVDSIRVVEGINGTEFSLSLPISAPGYYYQVESSISLSDPLWGAVSEVLTGDGTLLQFQIPVDSEDDQVFYRVNIWHE